MKESFCELWHNKSRSWIEKKEYNNLHTHEVRVKARYSFISLGTEKLITTELIPQNTVQKMQIPYSQGDYNKNFTYGYSLVGEVINEDSALKNKYVHLLHPHQEIAFVKELDLFEIPEGVPLRIATLASNMETAVNAVWDSNLSIGDNVLIVGYGIVGALVALIASNIPGIRITIIEKDKQRIEIAKKKGHKVLTNGKTIEHSFDVAINTSGNEFGLQLAIDKTNQEGKIVELSWYGSKKVNISLGDSFHYGRKKIISSQVSQIPKDKQQSWTYSKRKKLVFELLKKLNPEYLLDKEIKFSDCPKFYELIRRNQINNIGVIINYNK